MHAFFANEKLFASYPLYRARRFLLPRLHNLAMLPRRIVRGKVVHAYWYASIVNFGDAITPTLLAHYGYTPIYQPPTRAALVSTGSVLNLFPASYAGTILGAGLMLPINHTFPAATVLGVRGALTRDAIGAPAATLLGDPGLLLPKLLTHTPPRKYLIGFVPHFLEKDDPRIAQLCQRYPATCKHIDVQRDPHTVLHEIAQCEYILSSSLHGLVVADALRLPSAWLVLSNKVIGAGFKFRDYYSAFNCDHAAASLRGDETLEQLVALTHPSPPNVDHIQTGLDRAFQELTHVLA